MCFFISYIHKKKKTILSLFYSQSCINDWLALTPYGVAEGAERWFSPCTEIALSENKMPTWWDITAQP